MELLPLGTNGYFPSFNRQTACYAITLGKTLILLDAGSGLFRLAEPKGKKLLKGIDYVHLFLSHYHLDHTFGFYSAFDFFRDKQVTVFADSEKGVFSELPPLGYFPVNYKEDYANFRFTKLAIGEQTIDSYKVTVRKQYHRGQGSLAFRFSFGLAYLTDTEFSEESINFVKDVPLLLHEHGVLGKDVLKKKNPTSIDYFGDGHVTTVGAATIAKKANVGSLVLIHHHPRADNKKLNKQLHLAQSLFSKTSLAMDYSSILWNGVSATDLT